MCCLHVLVLIKSTSGLILSISIHILCVNFIKCSFLSVYIVCCVGYFLCLRPVGPGGIMFSGCPSVRPSVRTRISLTRNLKNPWVDCYHTWPRGAP